MPRTSRSSLPLLAALLLLSPSLALAQPSDEPAGKGDGCADGDLDCQFTSTTNGAISSAYVYLAGIVITSLGAGATTTFFLVQQGSQKNEPALAYYLRHERESLTHAHALGAGAAVDDVAALLWIPHERALLGAMMRARRAELNAALDASCHDDSTCAALARRYTAILLDEVSRRRNLSDPPGNKDMTQP